MNQRPLTYREPEQSLSYHEKLRLTNRDALKALAALAVIVVVWLISGFGLAGVDVRVAGLPLWVVCSLLGTWITAIIAAVVLARSFRDYALDDAEIEETKIDEQLFADTSTPDQGGPR